MKQQVASWLDHLRQHHRVTVADRTIEERALGFHAGPGRPQVRHMLERPPSALIESGAGDTKTEVQPQAIVTDPRLPPVTVAQASAKPSTSDGT